MVFHDIDFEKEELDNTYIIKEIHEKVSVEHKRYTNLYCQKINTNDMFVRCIVNSKFVNKSKLINPNFKFEMGMKVILIKKELEYPERTLIVYDIVKICDMQNNLNTNNTN